MKEQLITKHIAGSFQDDVQFCVICGYILSDYRGACWIGEKSGGWTEGADVFVRQDRGCREMSIIQPDEDFKPCEP